MRLIEVNWERANQLLHEIMGIIQTVRSRQEEASDEEISRAIAHTAAQFLEELEPSIKSVARKVAVQWDWPRLLGRLLRR